jgi:hypothetical protein
MKPLLRSFLVCRNVIETEKGIDVEGIYTELMSDTFPLNVTTQFFTIWSDLRERDYTMEVRVFFPGVPDFQKYTEVIPALKYGSIYDFPVISPPVRLKIPAPGDIRFEIFLNDRTYGIFFMPVHYTGEEEEF